MLLLSFRLNKRRLGLLCGAAGAVVVLAAAAGVYLHGRQPDVPVSINSSGAVTKNYTVQTPEQRLAFIAQFGWEVEEEPSEVEEVLVPKEFDEVYTSYNELQKAQGLDLKRYAGKLCKRYTYIVTNYPGVSGEVHINLLVAENKVVGGDVCSTALDGFMHGFRYEG